MKKEISLQILRVFSMMMIVICHLFSETKISIFVNLAQFFNVGVFIFLFMSGYLYGRKNNIDTKKFLKKRFIKVMLPFYLFFFYIVLINIINESFSIKLFFSNLFNLQYIFGSLRGMEHLWFLTELMFCYFITPILFIIKKKVVNKKYIFYIIFFVISLGASVINVKFGNVFFYLLVYIMGFMYNEKNKKGYFKNILFIIIAIIVRIQFKLLFDATLLYDFVIVNLTHTLISVSIFNLFINLFKKTKRSKLINYLDNISFFVYVVHYQFMHGPLRIIDNKNCVYLLFSMFLSVVVSIIFANILYYISSLLSRRLEVK